MAPLLHRAAIIILAVALRPNALRRFFTAAWKKAPVHRICTYLDKKALVIIMSITFARTLKLHIIKYCAIMKIIIIIFVTAMPRECTQQKCKLTPISKVKITLKIISKRTKIPNSALSA